MRRTLWNLPRKYHLWVVVNGKEIYCGFQYSIEEFLIVLSKWEKREGFEEATMEVEDEED